MYSYRKIKLFPKTAGCFFSRIYLVLSWYFFILHYFLIAGWYMFGALVHIYSSRMVNVAVKELVNSCNLWMNSLLALVSMGFDDNRKNIQITRLILQKLKGCIVSFAAGCRMRAANNFFSYSVRVLLLKHINNPKFSGFSFLI